MATFMMCIFMLIGLYFAFIFIRVWTIFVTMNPTTQPSEQAKTVIIAVGLGMIASFNAATFFLLWKVL